MTKPYDSTALNNVSHKEELSPSTNDYNLWKNEIVNIIEKSKYTAVLNVNAELLALYWSIGCKIIEKQKVLGWGSQVIVQLSKDLSSCFPDDKGYSERNLRNMKTFANEYPDFPYLQVPLDKINQDQIWQVSLAKLRTGDNEVIRIPLTQITWYHHISLIPKTPDILERAFYIMETIREGWSRDVMLMQVANKYIQSKGMTTNNFHKALPPIQSDLAHYTFRDPYNFSFLGTVALQKERDIEKKLTERVTEFLLEMGRGFAFVGRQYHLTVDGDDYYIDILMYHLQLHCYVVVELKAVEFKPEFVSKLNFYISAIDENVKATNDNPTIGLLLCRTKSNTKAKYALRGVTQPLGIAQYETEKLFSDVASSLPQIEDYENSRDDSNEKEDVE